MKKKLVTIEYCFNIIYQSYPIEEKYFLCGIKFVRDTDNVSLLFIRNGRLAMLAIGGMIHHNFVTGGPLL